MDDCNQVSFDAFSASKKAASVANLGYFKGIFDAKVAQGFETVNGVKVKITDQATDPLGNAINDVGIGCIHREPEEFITMGKYLEDYSQEEVENDEEYHSLKIRDKQLANIVTNMPNLRIAREKEAAQRRERSMGGIKNYADEKKFGKDFMKYKELQILAGVRKDNPTLDPPMTIVEEMGSIMSNMERMMKELEGMHGRMRDLAAQIEMDAD